MAHENQKKTLGAMALYGLSPLIQRSKWGRIRWDGFVRMVSSSSGTTCRRRVLPDSAATVDPGHHGYWERRMPTRPFDHVRTTRLGCQAGVAR